MSDGPAALAVHRIDGSGVVDEQAGTTVGLDITLSAGDKKRLLIPLAAAVDAAVALLVAHELALKLRTSKGLHSPLDTQRIEIDGAEGMAMGASVVVSMRVKNGGVLSFALPPAFARRVGKNLISCAEAAEQHARRQH